MEEHLQTSMDVWVYKKNNNNNNTSEELRQLVGVQPITTVIKSGRLIWYGHVMRKSDEDWMKKCMEYRVEGRRPVGRPTRTWLCSVERIWQNLRSTEMMSMTGINGESML